MKLKSLGANCHELELNNGVLVLFSYETPVAVSLPFRVNDHIGVIRTDRMFSMTTRRHIKAWTSTTRTLPQDALVALIDYASLK